MVRVQDVSKMMDVSGIQTYVINSARVVFLSERPRPKGKVGISLVLHAPIPYTPEPLNP